METLITPTKIQIYLNPTGKTITDVKAETGCDYIINGGLFEGLSKPCPLLKVGGEWQTDQPWTNWGMSWDEAADCSLSPTSDKENFISCVALITPWGDNFTLQYPADMGGARQRTAWGILADGRHLLYVDKTGRTPEKLREYLRLKYDLVSLLMLDGGGSTQGIFNKDETVTSMRKVANLICFWTSEEGDDMPYTEPTTTLKRGAKGEGVKWLQDKLCLMAFDLDIDGDFGGDTEAAVKQFQSCYSLSSDGVVGLQTRTALKAVEAMINTQTTLADRLVSFAMEMLGATEEDAESFIKAYNLAAGANLPASSPWCQILAWYCYSSFPEINAPLTASCTVAMNSFKQSGRWYDKPQKGDLVYFDWDRSGDADHVGIVAFVSDSYISVIEGNSSGSTGDAVRYKTYDRNTTTIKGYARVCEAPHAQKKYMVIFTDKDSAERFAKAYGGKVIEYE